MAYRIIERTNKANGEKDYVIQERFLLWWEVVQYDGAKAIYDILEVALDMKKYFEEKVNIKYTKKVIA